MPAGEIQDRLALIMVNEAVLCLQEGVIGAARDGDLGAVLGLGFPPFRAGPFHHVDAVGADEVVDRLRALNDTLGLRFRPCGLLEELAIGDGFLDASLGSECGEPARGSAGCRRVRVQLDQPRVRLGYLGTWVFGYLLRYASPRSRAPPNRYCRGVIP